MHACGRISVGAWVQLYECVSVHVGNGASPTLNISLEKKLKTNNTNRPRTTHRAGRADEHVAFRCLLIDPRLAT